MVNTSTGIEPYFGHTWTRVGHLGEHEETSAPYADYRTKFPEGPLPDYFVTAMSLTPKEHVHMQAVIQKWTDASLSKTTNCPEDYTVAQIDEVYRLMYSSGCKGGTVYRDKSRSEQVLYTIPPKAEKPAKKEVKKKVRSYPSVRNSKTVSLGTPCGTVHVTLTCDDEGDPLEVFASTGRAGSEVMALTEALGRLLSLVMRLDSEVPAEDRLRLAIEQLQGIGGSNPIGLGPNRVSSLPDGIGKALGSALRGLRQKSSEVVTASLETSTTSAYDYSVKGDLCPECGNMSAVQCSGCIACPCGWSKC